MAQTLFGAECPHGPLSRTPQSFQAQRKPWRSLFVAVPCWVWMTAFTHFRLASLILPAPLCIAAFSGTASANYPRLATKPLPEKKRFKAYPIGYFHIDLTEVRTQEGKLYLFVAIDRTSKFTFARLVERATRTAAADFLRELITVVPYQIHTILTDNGTHFTTPGNVCSAASEICAALQRGEIFRAHAFELACAQNHIEHRLTKPNHPWTNGQVERMNRTLKEAPFVPTTT